MLTRQLPKNLRNVFFTLGMTMIAMAGAIQHIQAWSEADPSSGQLVCQVESATGVVLAFLDS